MRSTVTVTALCAVLLNTGLARANPDVLQPTSLETFAARPTAHVSWSKDLGRIEKGDVRVAVTVLVVEDAAQPPHRMRGVRLDLSNAKAADHVFLDSSKLVAVVRALDEIDGEVLWFKNEPHASGYSALGAAEFWHPDQRIHTLNAAFYVATNSSGLVLSAGNNESFDLPGYLPRSLAELLGKAIDELLQRSA